MMRRRGMRWLLLAVWVLVCLPMRAEWVLAAKQYEMNLTPVVFTPDTPFGGHSDQDPANWTLSYYGGSNPHEPDPVVAVFIQGQTNFISGSLSFPISQLSVWDGEGAPNYLPLSLTEAVAVCHFLTVPKRPTRATIPIHMRLTWHGNEQPGIYSATIFITAFEI